MTDYLEEHLERADVLLEQVRRMERGTSDFPRKSEDISELEEKSPGKEAENDEVSESENLVDGLWEQVNRIEERVDNWEADADEAIEAIEAPEKQVNQNENMVDGLGARRPVSGAAEQGSGEDAPSNVEKAERSQAPLADQLEALDRAVSALTAGTAGEDRLPRSRFPASLSGGRRTLVYPDMIGAVDRERSGGRGFNSAFNPSGEARSWAEQADRIFRRDSRRYDGGFSLY